MNNQLLFEFLEEKVSFYNQPSFTYNDPISIPHLFTGKEDIEIAGFLSATLSWGQRVTIINKGKELMNRMGDSPFDFILNASEKEINSFSTFVHRTFQGEDCIYFIHAIQQIYNYEGGLESVFTKGYLPNNSIKESIKYFREVFFSCQTHQYVLAMDGKK
jgi:uncharacterized protein (TIGR02757 family)